MITTRMNLGKNINNKNIKSIYCSIDGSGNATYSLEEVEDSTELSLNESRNVEYHLANCLELPYEFAKYSEIYRTNVINYIQFLLDNNLQERAHLFCGKLTKNRLDKFRDGDFKPIFGSNAKASKYVNVYCRGKYGDEFLACIDPSAYSSVFAIYDMVLIKSSDDYIEFKYMDFGTICVRGLGEVRKLLKGDDESWILKMSRSDIYLLCCMSEHIKDFKPQELRERYETLKSERQVNKSKSTRITNHLKVFLIKDKNNKSEVKARNLEQLLDSNICLSYIGHNKSIALYKIDSCSIKALESLTLGISGVRKLMNVINSCENLDFLTEQDVKVLKFIGGIAVNINFGDKCDLCGDYGVVDCYIPSRGGWSYICACHFLVYNCMLGDGLGQLLLPKEHIYAHLLK